MDTPLTSFPLQIYRAYDIRGKVSALTPQVVWATAHALAQDYLEVGENVISIGYDARITSPYYAAIMTDVFQQSGFEVKEIGCCSSPMLYFMSRLSAGNGVMITASHNPKSDNGIKWLRQNQPPSAEKIQQIGQRAKQVFDQTHDQAFLTHNEKHTHHFNSDVCQRYRQYLTHDIQLKTPFKVVLDGLNGSAGRCAVYALEQLGCEVIALRCEANGHFPDHAPDPSQTKHLDRIQQAILAHQADVGIALDGDGDRLVLLDEYAQVITADRLLALFADMTLAEHPKHEIVYDVKCSTLVRDVVAARHGIATMLRTGSSFLRQYIARSQGRAVFGGEYAGHYVFNDGRGLGYDDGLYAALRVLEYLEQSKQPLSKLMQSYPVRFGTEDLYISTHGYSAIEVLAAVKQQSQYISAELSEIDGIRLDFKDGFGIIRASNTGEYFTLRFDAHSQTELSRIQHIFVSMLAAYPEIASEIAQV